MKDAAGRRRHEGGRRNLRASGWGAHLVLAAFSLGLGPSTSCLAAAPEPGRWLLSLQFLGVTYHPDGGNTPQIYPLKLDRRAYVVIDVGAAACADRRLGRRLCLRFEAALYKDCAFVTAGCLHVGLRGRIASWGRSQVHAGLGPIYSFRQDWHRFKEYQDDEFYGRRVWRGWQYRYFPYAVEFEYLRRIRDGVELQYSVVPGWPLVITSKLGIRWSR